MEAVVKYLGYQVVYFVKDLRSKFGLSLFTYIPGLLTLISTIILSAGPKKAKIAVLLILIY